MDLLAIFEESDDLVKFSEGALIFQEGHEGDVMYVVMEGEVTVSLRGQEIARVLPGEMVGEMSLIDTKGRSATAIAKTDCMLAMIDRHSFDALLQYVPGFSRHVMSVLADRLQNAYEMIQS